MLDDSRLVKQDREEAPHLEELSDQDLELVAGGNSKNLHLVFNAHSGGKPGS